MKAGILLIALCLINPALAAEKPAKPAPAPPPAIERPPTVFEPQLLQLAETMGGLAFLADLCPDLHETSQSGQLWRDKTAGLIEAEATGPRLKGLLAGAYNRGFTGLEITHKNCTEAAQALYARDLETAHHLSQTLARRYSGN